MDAVEFVSAMERLGFVAVEPRPGFTHEFVHPETGTRRYVVSHEIFDVALVRLKHNLEAHRAWVAMHSPARQPGRKGDGGDDHLK